MHKHCTISLFLITIACVLPAAVLSQSTEAFKKKGWPVPAFDQLEIIEVKKIDIDGIEVLQTSFRVWESRPVLKLEGNRTCEFRDLASYSIGSIPFASKGDCYAFGVDPRYGKFHIGAIYPLRFYDCDGDGRFEKRSSGVSGVVVPKRLKLKYGPPPPAKR